MTNWLDHAISFRFAATPAYPDDGSEYVAAVTSEVVLISRIAGKWYISSRFGRFGIERPDEFDTKESAMAALLEHCEANRLVLDNEV